MRSWHADPSPKLLRSGAVVDVAGVQAGDVIRDPQTGKAATVLEIATSTPVQLELLAGVVTLPGEGQAPTGQHDAARTLIATPGMRVRRLYRWTHPGGGGSLPIL